MALFTLFDIQMKSNAHIDDLKLSFIIVVRRIRIEAFIRKCVHNRFLFANFYGKTGQTILVSRFLSAQSQHVLDAVLTGLLSALHKSVHIKFNGETIFQGSTFELCGFDLLAGERKVCQGKPCSSSIETGKEVAVKVQLLC